MLFTIGCTIAQCVHHGIGYILVKQYCVQISLGQSFGHAVARVPLRLELTHRQLPLPHLGLYPIVTSGKPLLNMIGNLV
jgi:hypothetical protein